MDVEVTISTKEGKAIFRTYISRTPNKLSAISSAFMELYNIVGYPMEVGDEVLVKAEEV